MQLLHHIELEYELHYDYEPAEPQTQMEPGCAENFILNAVMFRNINILPALTEEERSNLILKISEDWHSSCDEE
jgi:hypothetical protein